ncbi:MAG: hypothetical protein KY438_04230 [Actinobacteria bacterium]|nr:hypothetical protein [Actinomycetota bacterium]
MTMPTPRRTAVLATVLAVVVAACAGDDPGSAVPTSTPSTATASSPSSSTSSTTADESGTSTSPSASPGGGACPTAEGAVPPAGATDVSEASADVDGDGVADRVLAYRQGDGDRRVAVELTGGGTSSVDASQSSIDGPARLSMLGGVDLGGDGQTVLVVTGAGASVVVVGLFQFVECALSQVSFESGQPAELPVGGSVTHADGLECTDGTLIRLSAASADGENFSTTETRYRVDGNTLVELGTEAATHPTLEARYSTINCPGLERGL